MGKKEKTAKKETVRALKRFGATASAHGITAAIATKGKTRVFWMLVFFGSLACLGYVLYHEILDYITFKKTTNVEVKYEPLLFPAVTVCNMNPYKKSGLTSVPKLAALMQLFDSTRANNQTMGKQK